MYEACVKPSQFLHFAHAYLCKHHMLLTNKSSQNSIFCGANIKNTTGRLDSTVNRVQCAYTFDSRKNDNWRKVCWNETQIKCGKKTKPNPECECEVKRSVVKIKCNDTTFYRSKMYKTRYALFTYAHSHKLHPLNYITWRKISHSKII